MYTLSDSSCYKLKAKVVVIIGNGFDLNLGLKTSYKDFVESKYFTFILGENNGIDKECYDFNKNKIKLQLINNGLAAYIFRQARERNWYDIENDIKEYIISSNGKSDAEIIAKEIYSIRYFLYKYMQHTIGINGIYLLKKKHYVGYEFINQLIQNNASYTIWNFNYTSSCESIFAHLNYEESVFSKLINYPHSNILSSCRIEAATNVLGTNYDEQVAKICPLAIKSLSIEGYKIMRDKFNKELMDADTIIIFGHSMGDSDSDYFKEVLSSSKNLKKVFLINYDEYSACKVISQMQLISENVFLKKQASGIIDIRKFYTIDYKNGLDNESLNEFVNDMQWSLFKQ